MKTVIKDASEPLSNQQRIKDQRATCAYSSEIRNKKKKIESQNLPSIVQSSRKARSNSFPKVTMKKIPLQKSAKRKKEKKDKGEENPSPHLNSTCFLSNFETRSWKVIFPPFFPATWHSESKSIWAKRTQCAKLLAYRAHGSFQFSPSFFRFLLTQSSNPPVESISNVPPFLLLLLLFDSSPPFFIPANAISICQWYSVAISWKSLERWLSKRVVNYARERAGEEGQRVNVHAPPFPRIERLWWEDTLNKTGSLENKEYGTWSKFLSICSISILRVKRQDEKIFTKDKLLLHFLLLSKLEQ